MQPLEFQHLVKPTFGFWVVLVFGIFAALAEFERDLISERTKAGLSSSRARGRVEGAPRKMTLAKLRLAIAAMSQRETVVGDLCRELGVTRQTLYRHVAPDRNCEAATLTSFFLTAPVAMRSWS